MRYKIKPFISSEDIQKRVKEIAVAINNDFKDKNPLLIGILKGAFIFLADLAKHLTISCEFDFMAVSSYGDSTISSGVVRILKDLDESILDRNIILVEDIVDTGLTLDYILNFLKNRSPREIKICVLLDKKECRKKEVPIHYLGFVIPNKFVVGYGLDYQQKFRNLPYIGILEKEGD